MQSQLSTLLEVATSIGTEIEFAMHLCDVQQPLGLANSEMQTHIAV